MNCGIHDDDDDQDALRSRQNLAPASSNRRPCAESSCSQEGKQCNNDTCSSAPTPAATLDSGDSPQQGCVCMKCKTARAVVLVRQREPLCQACLEAGISGKVRAIKTNRNQLLLPYDHAAIAFSGGFASQALLCTVLGMRKDASTPRKERGKIDFNLSVVHINEAAAYGLDAEAEAAHGRAVRQAASRCGAGGPTAAVHEVPLSDVFMLLDQGTQGTAAAQQQRRGEASAPEPAGQRGRPTETVNPGTAGEAAAAAAGGREARDGRLRALLQAVSDPTGREDLIRHLRGRLLGAVAGRLGACKLMVGDTATAMAARVISETAKGRGYSLPGGIQLLDARGVEDGQPAVLLPLREVLVKETVFFCWLRGLRPVTLPYTQPGGTAAAQRRSVNALSASFVESLQANLPSTIFTILRTAAALQPFPFNCREALDPPPRAAAAAATAATAAAREATTEADGAGDATGGGSPSGRGAGAQQGPLVCCVLCRAPLTRRELEAIAAARAAVAAAAAAEVMHRGSGQPPSPGVAASSERGTADAAAVAPGDDSPQGGGGAAAAREEVEAADSDADTGAPFCTSCRTQILFTPEESATVTAITEAPGRAGRRGPGGVLVSNVLGLLPAALRS